MRILCVSDLHNDRAAAVRLAVEVRHALATEMAAARFQRHFLQMRGRFTLDGRLGGVPVTDSGEGFFETYVPAPSAGVTTRPTRR